MFIDMIALFFLTTSGSAKEVKNSRSMSSCSCQCGGIVPDRSSADSFERLLKDNPLCMVPCPHGDAAAARNEFRLNRRRLLSMVSLSSIVSHMMSAGSVDERNCWKFCGYSVLCLSLGIMSLSRPLFRLGLTTCRMLRYMVLHCSDRIVFLTIPALCFDCYMVSGLVSVSYLARRSA